MSVAPGSRLLDKQWLAERISDMGISWGTGDSRVSGTLWWCMAASSLVDPIVNARAAGLPTMDPALENIGLEIRPDGGVERVLAMCDLGTDAAAFDAQSNELGAHNGDQPEPVGHALRHTLSAVIPVVAEVSGAGVAALWAIVADAIGNRALDAGAQEIGSQLAREVSGRLPVPRFSDIGGRAFVRRISCCLVFEVPGCDMCTSCPKRPAAQREALLAELAAR
ncbi:(2Fe-2S)-binding protein [Nocardia sp. NBC_01503]|uniref:(2Fe-2S)-binding protein n=1 Tax=Nocardia sp. NBC_01503 TaxID=2975997 RepID=UPI002E7C23E6|nr:(2Fe-2S)-binding protein [Nocardia sp. NBC_01503]WTL30257.1 (2Fe-2S)-binding protein [Nocardia sp. NBC_01503]